MSIDETKGYAINLQKSSPEFKKGFIFAMRCIIDMVKGKDESYTMADHIKFLSDFLEIQTLLKE